MEKLYRMKNPITGQYYCKSADLVEEADKNMAIIYKESTAQKILHDANTMGEIFMEKILKSEQRFSGYILEEAKIDDIDILPEWESKIKLSANVRNISLEESTKEFRKEIIDYWDKWALYNPFSGEKIPSTPCPF